MDTVSFFKNSLMRFHITDVLIIKKGHIYLSQIPQSFYLY